MIFKTAATVILSLLSLQLMSKPLDTKNIHFLGPIIKNSTIKPTNTPHQQAIINTLLPKLMSTQQSLTVFGDEIKWQPLNQVTGLTLPGMQALKFNFTAPRFIQGKLVLSGIEKSHVFLNAKPLSGKTKFNLTAATGDHQVVIIAEQVDNWKNVELSYEPKAEHDQLVLTNKKTRALSAKQLFDAPTISAVSMAPNGDYYVITERLYQDNTGNKAASSTTFYKDNGDILYRLDGVSANQLKWRDDSKQVVFVKGDQVTLLNLKTLKKIVLAEQLAGASNFQFYDRDTLLFSWSNKPKSKHTLVKHLQGLEDRWSYARNNRQIFMLDIPSGAINTLTESKRSTSLHDYDSNKKTLLVSRSIEDYAAPPHMLTELIEINLNDNSRTPLGQYRTLNSAKYAKNGIYVIAGPDFKNGLGRALPENMLANNYDGQLYWMDRKGNKSKALSKKFDPAISSMQVLKNHDVVLKVQEQDTQRLYLFDESKVTYKKLKTGFDVVNQFSVSQESKGSILVAGTNASYPQQLKKLNVKSNKPKTLWDSKPLAFENTEIATLEEFNFTNKQGIEIKGRVYLPHNLDKTKQYPALIYYYGGTSPVSRGFTGRYPFNLWAANGYLVYVLQPTGATGFGQKFSAAHVNAWGEHTAEDIIQGTQAFLKNYAYVDKNRLGNLGASYGGFMTMLLATKTDLFSASISHAGISNITSYWGQGWWGYLYSGEASKNSFPWNNPTLYSQHSPVFHADKVNSPLLLLHGDADTNVPVGESHTMYTALKLLGKDVEMIEYKNTDHQVFARDKRFHWWNTMLAYFDMHLKDQPQWWNSIYN